MGKLIVRLSAKGRGRSRQVEDHLSHRRDPSKCEAVLKSLACYDRFACEPRVMVCYCGQAWVHVCDEAEGCSWVLREDYVPPPLAEESL